MDHTPPFSRFGKATIGIALTHYAKARPDAEPTCRSALKMLYPSTKEMTPDGCRAFFNKVPLRNLREKLADGGTRWSADVEKDLIERGFAGASHLKNYPARITGFLEFAEKVGLVERKRSELLAEWGDYLENAFSLLPADKRALGGMLEAGMTLLLERYTFSIDDLDSGANKVNSIRSANRRMAELASIAGLTPADFADQVIIGPRQDEIVLFTGQETYGCYCRNLWNAAALAFPEMNLPCWPDRRPRVSLPVAKWPESLAVGFDEALLGTDRTRGLKLTTVKTRKQSIGSFLGILDSLGINLDIFNCLTPKDAVRLLTQGIPRECLSGDPLADAPYSLIQRLFRDEDYRSQTLQIMLSREGSREGREAASNPYVDVYLDLRLTDRKFAAANNLIDAIGVINREYLHIREPHDNWITQRLKYLDRARKSEVTDYDAKKKVVFRTPRLWASLVAEVQKLAEEVRTSPRRGTARWATQCRDALVLWLLLTYPIRVGNATRMEIGRNFDPTSFRIRFDTEDVKNERQIEFELPSHGPYGEGLRALTALYLAEARPILLAGGDSRYFLVPDQRTPNAGPCLRRTGINDILIALSENKLLGALPPDLGALNPHLLRHIVAVYQIAVRNDANKAAQLLNDSLETVLKHYADILPSARQETKSFYDTYDLSQS